MDVTPITKKLRFNANGTPKTTVCRDREADIPEYPDIIFRCSECGNVRGNLQWIAWGSGQLVVCAPDDEKALTPEPNGFGTPSGLEASERYSYRELKSSSCSFKTARL